MLMKNLTKKNIYLHIGNIIALLYKYYTKTFTYCRPTERGSDWVDWCPGFPGGNTGRNQTLQQTLPQNIILDSLVGTQVEIKLCHKHSLKILS